MSEAESLQSDNSHDFEDNVNAKEYSDLRLFLIDWYSSCNITKAALTRLLHGLKKFGHSDLPMDARTLLSTPRTGIVNVDPMGSGTYAHYGLELALANQFDCVDEKDIPSTVYLDIHIDGLSVSKSSRSEVWPILGKVCNLPAFTEPFIIGAYHGIGKPESANRYLEDFIHDYLYLRDTGFIYNNRVIKVIMDKVISDTVARNFIMCYPPHNSRCGKCVQQGQTIQRRRVFLENDADLRTDENFRVDVPPKYANSISPLEGVISLVWTRCICYTGVL